VNSDVMDYDGYTYWLEMRRAADYCKQHVLLDLSDDGEKSKAEGRKRKDRHSTGAL
jgi:hypothetical protein